MNNYFKVIDDLKAAAIAEPFINTVTQGDITDVDLNKSTIYPVCHLMVNNATLTGNSVTLDMSVILMDIMDFSKETVTSDIRGNNNEMDVLNTQLAVAGRLQALLLRAQPYRDTYQLDSPFNCEPFTDSFDVNVAGWTASFSIVMANDSTSAV
jgi:hypothetical protein|tara:strand:- start:884 stop:1342 length:459 start_codon:yes stop_codon:yes gene_type:complete